MIEAIKNFEELCEEKIKAKLLPFEVMRQKIHKRYKITKICALFIIFFTPVAFVVICSLPPDYYNIDFLANFNEYIFTFFITVIAITLSGCSLLSYSENLKRRYGQILKENFLPIVMPIFKDLKYLKNKKIISDEEIIAAGFFDILYDVRKTKESFTGEYKGYKFKMCEDIFRNRRINNVQIINKFINISINNSKNMEATILQDETFQDVLKKKKIKTIIGTLLVTLTCFAVFIPLIFDGNSKYILICILAFILAGLLYYHEKQYGKFQINNRQSWQTRGELAKILSDINSVSAPRLSNVGDNIMLNVKFGKDEDIFEFGNMNIPLNSTDLCKNFIKQIMLVYKFIDYIESKK